MTSPSAAERRPVDAARIREVMEPLTDLADEWDRAEIRAGQPYEDHWDCKITVSAGQARAARSLLHDLDAQGAEPDHEVYGAGYGQGQFDTLQRIREYLCDECDAKLLAAAPGAQGLAPAGWRPIETAPKDGSVIIVNGGIAHWHNSNWQSLTGHDWPGRPILWPVTHWQPFPATFPSSSAEAGERTKPSYEACCGAHKYHGAKCERCPERKQPDRGASAERPLSDKTDAWDEEHIKRRSIIRTPGGFKAIDREPARPLSECDDELFRSMLARVPAWDAIERELHRHGWLLWHGGDKAPVEGEVEYRTRHGFVGIRDAKRLEWSHGTSYTAADIIAYRPVLAKAEPAHDLYKTGDPDAPEVIKDRNGEVILGLCRICRKAEAELDEPCERAEPTADAGEVERLPWRVGRHFPIHIYEGDVPIATAQVAAYAKQIVSDHNAALRLASSEEQVASAQPAPQPGAVEEIAEGLNRLLSEIPLGHPRTEAVRLRDRLRALASAGEGR